MKKIKMKFLAVLMGMMMSLTSMATLTTSVTQSVVCAGNAISVSFLWDGSGGIVGQPYVYYIEIIDPSGSCIWETIRTFTTTAISGTYTLTVPSTYTVCGAPVGSSTGKTMSVRVKYMPFGPMLPAGGFPVTVYSSTPSPLISGVSSACSGAQITLTGSSANSYLWNTGATTSSISVSQITNTVYTLSETNSCGAGVGSKTVTTNPIPSADAGTNTTICKSKSTVLGGVANGIYSWSPSTSLNNANISNPVATPTITTTYTLSTSNSCGTAKDTVVVTVNPTPTVIITAGSLNINLGDSTTLVASINDVYLWSTGEITQQIVVKPIVSGNTTYTLTGSNSYGCSNTAIVTISVTQPTGILESQNKNSSGKISLYPNPANDEVNIQIENSNDLLGKNIEVSVFDITGRKILSKQIANNGNNIKFSVSELNVGNYILTTSANGLRYGSDSKLVIVVR